MKMYQLEIYESESRENIVITQQNYMDDESIVLISYEQLPAVLERLKTLYEQHEG